jgi:hypothetical protein
MNNWKLTTPVALIIFNRPDVTERVFAEISKAKPQKLFLIGDGPRSDRVGDAEKVAATRAIVERVTWECEVVTNFSTENMGSKMRPKTGIDWVFDQVEEAIILEDDCLPHPTFFRFCQELLDRYRQDQRISMISGNNFQPNSDNTHDSYYFSKYPGTWGLATWRNRWRDSYDIDMKKWPIIRENGSLKDILGSSIEARYWTRIFESVYTGRINTAWDYQWLFAEWLESRIGITPRVNLISNIGFGVDATHTSHSGSNLANRPTEEILFPLKHPSCVNRNSIADKKIFDHVYDYKPTWPQRIANKIGRIIELRK